MTGNTAHAETTTIAEYRAVGSGRMTIAAQPNGCYTFHISGPRHTLTISDNEATQLAESILQSQKDVTP